MEGESPTLTSLNSYYWAITLFFLKKGFFKDHFISKIFSVISVDFLIRKLKDEVFFLQSWAWIHFSQILPSMSMVFTSFNIVCCCKCRVFTHFKVWWNQLNRLGNTFIHKCISVSKLKTNGISPVFLWMFFEATFSRSHVVFVISDEGEHGRHLHHVNRHRISERQHAPGDEAVGNICNILRNIGYTFVYLFCFTCYEHKR